MPSRIHHIGLFRTVPRIKPAGYTVTSPWRNPVADIIHSNRAAEPVGPYPHARRAGNLLFLSGVGPRKRGSKVIPGLVMDASGREISHDIEQEMRSCFENCRLVLEESGATWGDIIDITVFMTAMKADWAVYNRVYAEFFPPGPGQPCRTTVELAGLPQGGDGPIHFEVKIIAAVKS